MPFELFVALRYLLARRKQAFISLISAISAVGVGVGVMALLIVIALMTGLQAELRDRILGSTAHIYVGKVAGMPEVNEEIRRLLEIPRVRGAAPVIVGKALIQSGSGEIFIDIKGIEPELEKTVTELQSSIRSGSVEALDRGPDAMPGILIGTELALALDVEPGDQVRIFPPEGSMTPFGPVFRPTTFEVVGTFNFGLFEFDSSYGFVHLEVARRLLRDVPPFIELRIDDMFRAEEVVRTIVSRLGPEYTPQHWADLNRNLFSALWLEKMAMSITIGLIVMVAALNIIASLILLVMEKNRDIAILRTMGSSAASIRKIFMLQGLIIGLVGTASGAIAGYGVIYVLDRFRLISIPTDVYQISYVPFTLHLSDFLIVVGAALLICFVATIYPARQAARLDPAQALRYQ